MTVATQTPTATPFDRWGRRRDCFICGEPLIHPPTGRTRIRCGDPICELRWRKMKRAMPRKGGPA